MIFEFLVSNIHYYFLSSINQFPMLSVLLGMPEKFRLEYRVSNIFSLVCRG